MWIVFFTNMKWAKLSHSDYLKLVLYVISYLYCMEIDWTQYFHQGMKNSAFTSRICTKARAELV